MNDFLILADISWSGLSVRNMVIQYYTISTMPGLTFKDLPSFITQIFRI